jgi:hypothetical protein
MRNPMRLVVLCAIALLMSVPAAAQMIPENSTLILDQRTDVGGTVLEPGTYMIKSVAESRDRSVVTITNPDGSKTFATVLTVPHHMDARAEKPNTEFVFYETPAGELRALRTWYPSDPVRKFDAYDIVYSDSRARELARLVKSNVVSYADTVASTDYTTTEIHTITPEAKIEAYVAPEPTRTVTGTTTTTTITETDNNDTDTDTTMTETTTPTQVAELPRTAGNVPLLALLGMLTLAGAAVVRFIR